MPRTGGEAGARAPRPEERAGGEIAPPRAPALLLPRLPRLPLDAVARVWAARLAAGREEEAA
jgi:hypothetical protein